MSTLEDWITESESALSLPPGAIDSELRDELLDVTRQVAHGVARIAGPLTCYLLGLAVARGMSPTDALAAVRANLPEPEVTT